MCNSVNKCNICLSLTRTSTRNMQRIRREMTIHSPSDQPGGLDWIRNLRLNDVGRGAHPESSNFQCTSFGRRFYLLVIELAILPLLPRCVTVLSSPSRRYGHLRAHMAPINLQRHSSVGSFAPYLEYSLIPNSFQHGFHPLHVCIRGHEVLTACEQAIKKMHKSAQHTCSTL